MLNPATLVLTVLLASSVFSATAAYHLKANTTNSTVAVLPSVYNKFCYQCIFANYTYCQASSTCISAKSNCSSGSTYTNTTGCPTQTMCDYGVQGYGYIGQNLSNTTLGYETIGSASFKVPAGEPCVAAIVNVLSSDLDFKLVGSFVGAYSLTLDFPFNKNFT